jgi:uncharacterized protein
MRTYVFTLKSKQRNLLTPSLLTTHVSHLKALKASGHLVLCGPYSDDDSALQILQAANEKEAVALFEKDPFVIAKYYAQYEVKELFDANDSNNWLMDSDQTKSNLK